MEMNLNEIFKSVSIPENSTININIENITVSRDDTPLCDYMHKDDVDNLVKTNIITTLIGALATEEIPDQNIKYGFTTYDALSNILDVEKIISEDWFNIFEIKQEMIVLLLYDDTFKNERETINTLKPIATTLVAAGKDITKYETISISTREWNGMTYAIFGVSNIDTFVYDFESDDADERAKVPQLPFNGQF